MFVLQLSHNVGTKGCERAARSRPPCGVAGLRRWALVALGTLSIVAGAGCSGVPDEEEAVVGVVEGFAGLAVSDEPRAALLARDVLGNGGNAVDAAVTMYFVMSVTLPSRASLGSVGACVLYDSSENKAEALLFLPRAGAKGGVVPQAPRAMAALHARHGLRRWEQLLIPAEKLARFGHPVSRAFARDILAAAGRIEANPDIAKILRNHTGELPGEGDKIVQLDLAGVLGGLRTQGAAYLYGGLFTQRFAAAATSVGRKVTADEVRRTLPTFVEPVAVEFGAHTLFFTAPPAANGLVAAQLWEILAEVIDVAEEGTADRAHGFVEAAARAFADRADWMAPGGEAREDPAVLVGQDHLERLLEGYDRSRHTPSGSLSPRPAALAETPHGASFVAADRWSNVVACSFTMNGLFGDFRMAPGTGILLSAPPSAQRNGMLSPSAAILANTRVTEAYFAGAASGGSAAPTALVSVMLGALIDEAPLREVVARPRFHHGGSPDVTFYEKGAPPAVVEGLRERGHFLRESPGLGRVNVLYCRDSFKRRFGQCEFATDPRGSGLGFLVQ